MSAASGPVTNEPILLAPATSQLAAGAKRWSELLVRSLLTNVDSREPRGTGDGLRLVGLLAPLADAARDGEGAPRRVAEASRAAAVGARAYRDAMPPAPLREAMLPEGERVV